MNLPAELGIVLATALLAACIAYKLTPLSVNPLGRWRVSVSPSVLDWLAVALVLLFFILWAWLDLSRYEAFGIYGFDFSVFDQVVYNTLQGRLFENTIVVDAPILLAQRFSPILIALAPLEAIKVDPRWLVVMPAFATASASMPLYWFARSQIGRGLGLVALIAFLLSPGAQFAGLDQFYELALTLPLFMLAVAFLFNRRYAPFLACLLVALLCKEEVGFIAAGMGLYIFLFQRKKWGILFGVASVAWVFLLLQVILPMVQGGATYYYFGGSQIWGKSQYAYLGDSLGTIIMTILTNPRLVFEHLFIAPKITALLLFVIPLGFLPLVGAEIACLSIPTLAYTLLSDHAGHYAFGLHHYAPVLATLALAMVVGMRRVLTWRGENLQVKAAIGVFALISSLTSYFFFAPAPFALNFNASFYTTTAHSAVTDTVLKLIPPNAAVLAQMELSPHLDSREHIYLMHAIPCLGRAEYAVADTNLPWYEYHRQVWQDLANSSLFAQVANQDGVILFQRSAPPVSLNAQFGEMLTLEGASIDVNHAWRGGDTLQPILWWRFSQSTNKPQQVRLSVTDERGHVWVQEDHALCGGLPWIGEWRVGDSFVEEAPVRLPPTMPSGLYSLLVSVNGGESETSIALISVLKNTNSFTASDLQIPQPLFVDMRELRFLGSTFLPATMHPGDELQAGLYWRARNKPLADYLVTVQLRDGDDQVVAEHSARPADNTYSTLQWNAGEVLLDWHDFVLPATLVPGEYTVQIVLSDATSGEIAGKVALKTIRVVRD